MIAASKKSAPRSGERAARNSGAAVSPARTAAFEVLRRVEEEAAFASVLLAASDEELRQEDRALCYELVLGVLRRQLWLDRLIEHYGRRSVAKLDAPVRLALRLGLYQLRFLQRVPASAAVNESVNLTHLARVRSAAGFVNAVLRRAAREPNYDPTADLHDSLERLSVETSHPQWLIERWTRAFGFNEAANFARANNETPPIAFRVVETGGDQGKFDETSGKRRDQSEALTKLRAAGGRVEASRVAPNAWRIEGAGQELRELVRRGLIYVQDEASQLVAHVLGARAGERVLDVCAAPGSKTTHIASMAHDKAFVVAGDVRARRLRVIRETSARQGLRNIQLVSLDARAALPFADASFDRVLVDAPCTGTGTLRRNPEIRWRIRETDIAELAAQQQIILAQAARLVRRTGGRLVYSTCSIEPEENEAVIKSFLREHADFKLTRANASAPMQLPNGMVRTWPQRDGADGFFIALFERAD